MRKLRLIVVAALGAMLLSQGPAWAWNPDPSVVEKRLGDLKSAWKGLDPRSVNGDKFSRAKQAEKPTWVQKGSWSEERSGKKYFFAVGSASGIRNESLRVSTAENRARAEMTKMVVGYRQKVTKNGEGTSIETRVDTELEGVESIDWYTDGGEFFALLVYVK
jgi:hypothetical protein